MITKTFEVRDRGTFIPVMAVKLWPESEADRYLIARSGYGTNAIDQAKYVMIGRLDGAGKFTSDVFEMGPKGTRTMEVAGRYIIEYFEHLPSGSVIDVEYILQEKPQKKISESQEDRGCYEKD